MNKEQVALKVAERLDSTKKDALLHIDALLEVITEAVIEGETVSFVNFGKFEAKLRKEREGLNPATKEKMIIPAQKSVRFQVGKGLKDAVKNG
jgi:DNA-binding protein HU-beta